MNPPEGSVAWAEFMAQVDELCVRLGCYSQNAWFRGQPSNDWGLLPSLFRVPDCWDWRYSTKVGPQLRRIQLKAKGLHGDEIDALREQASALVKELDKSSDEARIALQELNKVLRKLSDSRQDRRFRVERLVERTEHDYWSKLALVREGEADLFHGYVFRSAASEGVSSWATLGEMQHYGAPTRLLDWSESLAVALYFAFEDYMPVVENANSKNPEQLMLRLGGVVTKRKPTVWVLNPYKLAEWSTGKDRVWDLREHELDYATVLLGQHSWPHEHPVPMYSPWRNPRIVSQRGMMTVHGWSRAPLEDQAPKAERIVGCVTLEDERAILYGVQQIGRMVALGKYALFKDLTQLSRHVSARFFVDRSTITDVVVYDVGGRPLGIGNLVRRIRPGGALEIELLVTKRTIERRVELGEERIGPFMLHRTELPRIDSEERVLRKSLLGPDGKALAKYELTKLADERTWGELRSSSELKLTLGPPGEPGALTAS